MLYTWSHSQYSFLPFNKGYNGDEGDDAVTKRIPNWGQEKFPFIFIFIFLEVREKANTKGLWIRVSQWPRVMNTGLL